MYATREGPTPDGSIPPEVVYGPLYRNTYGRCGSGTGASAAGNNVYGWKWIWLDMGSIILTGFGGNLKSVTLLSDRSDVDFEHGEYRVLLKGLPEECPEPIAGLAVFKLEFETKPEFHANCYFPQLNKGNTFGIVPATDQ